MDQTTPDKSEAQRFRADDARKTDALVEKMRALLDGVPVAIAVNAVGAVRRDLISQLSFRRTEFQV